MGQIRWGDFCVGLLFLFVFYIFFRRQNIVTVGAGGLSGGEFDLLICVGLCVCFFFCVCFFTSR